MEQTRKLDRRIARTRRSLSTALIELASEIGYDQISIRDLTQRANIGYATFFRHFRSKEELATYCLKGVVSEFLEAATSAESLYEECVAIYTVFDRRRDVCHFGLSLPRDHPALNPIWQEVTQFITDIYSAQDESAIPLEVSANHLMKSCHELFCWWLTDGRDYSIEQMALMQSELIIKATESSALNHRTKVPREVAPT